MTNLAGQQLSKSKQTRTGAKTRTEIDLSAKGPGCLEEAAVRGARSPAERESRAWQEQRSGGL